MYANPEYCLVIDGDEFANGSKIQLWKCRFFVSADGGWWCCFLVSFFFLVEVSNH